MDHESRRIGAALEHIARAGNFHGFPGTRSEKLALVRNAARHGLIAWEKSRGKYELTRSGVQRLRVYRRPLATRRNRPRAPRMAVAGAAAVMVAMIGAMIAWSSSGLDRRPREDASAPPVAAASERVAVAWAAIESNTGHPAAVPATPTPPSADRSSADRPSADRVASGPVPPPADAPPDRARADAVPAPSGPVAIPEPTSKPRAATSGPGATRAKPTKRRAAPAFAMPRYDELRDDPRVAAYSDYRVGSRFRLFDWNLW